MQVTVRGIGASPGIAIGPALTYHVQSFEVPQYAIDDPAAELHRYDKAVDQERERLTVLYDQTKEDLGERHADIFKGMMDMLEDVALRPEIERRLEDEGVNVEWLVDDIMRGYSEILEQVDDPLFRDRASDFVTMGRRILNLLLNRESASLEKLERPTVVVAPDLSPAETVNMDTTNTLGLATDGGGPTSHMAILARAFEIPAVVGLRYIGRRCAPGDTLIVDGSKGVVILRPTESTLAQYRSEKERLERERQEMIQVDHEGPCITSDGHEIITLSNIELPVETKLSIRARCQGVGLYRTEYLFLNRPAFPTEEAQYEAYKDVLESMRPLPVTIRTLDLGGDKVLSHLSEGSETNPQLGWRSIRLCLDRPDLFKAQLRALFRASVHGNLRIMFPMISSVEEMDQALAVTGEVRDDLTKRGVPFSDGVRIGSMIEVPSAVMIAPDLARRCQFFSVGTNDLIQYCLAVDRGNERTAWMYRPAHPAVLRMLKQTVDAAKKAGIPCSICGEMAGDPMYTELLIGLGFEVLSMSAVSLPRLRSIIASIRLSKAKRLARKLLTLETATEAEAILAERYRATAMPAATPTPAP